MSDGETEAEFEAHGLSSSIPLTTTPERCSPSPPLLHGSAEHIGTMADTYYNAWWNQRRGVPIHSTFTFTVLVSTIVECT